MCCDDPPHKRYWRLYYLLDLIPPVTSKQVKWNFRKVTLRHHYYKAYLVLYNRSRKYFYDAIGEDAYGFIESGAWGPIVPFLGIVGSTLLYSIVMLVELAMLILFFAFLGARVDDVITWSWQSVVAPLMAFVCVAWLVSLFALIVSFASPRTWREGMAAVDRISPVGNFAATCCYFCIPFVIGYHIRNDPHAVDGNCLRYMVMPILGDIFYYLTSLVWRWPRRLSHQMEVENNETSGVVTWGIFIMAFLNMGCGIAQWVLIGKKIDKTLNRSWYIIFIPFCVRAGVRIAEACLRSLMKYYQGVRSQIGVAFDTVGSFFVNGILLISLYFVAVRIERGKRKCRMARALIPVYITLAYMFLAMIVTMIYLLVRSCSKSREESRINNAWVPPQDEAPAFGASGAAPGAAVDTSSTGSGSGPIPGEVGKDRDWDDFDGNTSPSSAAFPSATHDAREPAGGDGEEEYDDFYSDEEEDVFPREEESPRSAYGQTPRTDVEPSYYDGEDDADDRTPASARNDDRNISPRKVEPVVRPVAAAAAAASPAAVPVDPRTEPTPRDSRTVSQRPRKDLSTLTGDSEEEPESDYTYEYDEESYTEQTGVNSEDYYEYSEYSDEPEESRSESAASSVYSSSFASSQDAGRR